MNISRLYLLIGSLYLLVGVILGMYMGGAQNFELAPVHAHINLHVRVLHGRDPHHITEAQFKAVARALRAATEYDGRITGIASTKGAL